MSKKTQYPIYFRRGGYSFYCIYNKETAMYIELYDISTKIQYDNYTLSGTWVYEIWKEDQANCTLITKAEFNKAYGKAEKILQEKSKT